MLDVWSDLVRHTGLEGVDAFNENKIMKRLRYCVDEAARELPSVQSAQGMYESFPIVASFFGRKGLFPLQVIQEKNGGDCSQTASIERKRTALLPGG